MRVAIILALLMAAPAWAAQQPAAQQPTAKQPTAKDKTDQRVPVVKAKPAKPAAEKQPAAEKAPPTRDMGKWMTIVGEVMDPACFLEAGEKSIGPLHYQCALECAKSGQTLALYDREDDRIYFIAGELPGKNPNEPLMPYIHQKVDVTGNVFFKAGVYGIVINKVIPHQEKADPPAK